MIVRTHQDRAFKGKAAVGEPRRQAVTIFPSLYMRPNIHSDGGIPAAPPLSTCPDIIPRGQDPVANWMTALATTQSYAADSGQNISGGQPNFIYVRGRNGGTVPKTVTVTLYFAPSGIVQAPSQWQGNVIPTDHNQPNGNIRGAAAGTVAVCDSTFNWNNPPSPPANQHFCLFAQFNDAANSNPFPDIGSVFDMGHLIQNNLGWGWRNVTWIPDFPDWQLSQPLAIPANFKPLDNYKVQVVPTGWVGWQIEFECSRTDANGQPIKLPRTTIVTDGAPLGLSSVPLEAGFLADFRVNLFGPAGQKPPVNAHVAIDVAAVVTSERGLREAEARGLVDPAYLRRLKASAPELGSERAIYLPQGTYNYRVSDSRATRSWWRGRELGIA